MLTKKLQFQALIDRLAGLQTPYSAQDFEGSLQRCWLALDSAPSGQAMHCVYRELDSEGDRKELLHMLRTLLPGQILGALPTLTELGKTIRPINWVWKGWIPRGMVSLLGAAPGSGKSLVALDLCRRIIHHTAFPDGQPVEGDNPRVVYIDAESALPLHYARARHWQMDTSQVFMKLPDRNGSIDLTSPDQRDRLLDEIARNQPELVVVDSFGSISSRGENDIEDVRELMNYFTWLSNDFQVGLLLIHHTRKGLAMRGRAVEFTMDDIRGSSHILASTRSLLGLRILQDGEKYDPNGPRKLEILKTNLCAYPPPLGIDFVRQGEVIQLKWGAVAEASTELSRLAQCKAWLEITLRQNGEMKPADLFKQAEEDGYSRACFYRAREELGRKILTIGPKHSSDTRWAWNAPSPARPPADPPPDEPADTPAAGAGSPASTLPHPNPAGLPAPLGLLPSLPPGADEDDLPVCA